jgi:putative membrane protein
MFNQGRSSPSRAWFLIPVVIAILIVTGIAAAIYFHGPAAGVAYPFYGWWFPFPFFIFIPIIFIAFFAFRWFCWGGWGGGWYYGQGYDPALQILKERFARGEITKDQFEQMTKDLVNH